MPYKLLLADDSVTIQRVIELTFADEDVQVIAVGDGQQAMERIEAERPDIVLADVGMPERDGYDVAAFVKGTAHLAHIPVLLLTGAFEPIDEQRAGAVGCDGVLAKPFEPHMVITRVKELLAGGAASKGAPRGPAGLEESPVPAVEDGGAGAAEPVEAEPPAVADAPLRISRRTPIAVPGFGAPAPPAESHAALDEYFDRLDAAFTTLKQAPAAAADAIQGLPGRRRRRVRGHAGGDGTSGRQCTAGRARRRGPDARPRSQGAGAGARHRPGVLGALRRRARRDRP